jgi:hypothetical protein
MTQLNRFSPAASFGDKFFGLSAKERVIGVPANSLSGGFTVPDRERFGTNHVFLADDGGLPQATQTQQSTATTAVLAPEGSPSTAADPTHAPQHREAQKGLLTTLGLGALACFAIMYFAGKKH